MHCPKCNMETQTDWVACPKCGEKLSKKHICPNCNKVLRPDWQVCPYCREPVVTQQAGRGSAKKDPVTRIIHKDAKDFEEMCTQIEHDRLYEEFFSSVTQERVQVWKQAAEAGNTDAEHLYGLYLLKSAFDVNPSDEQKMRSALKWFQKAASKKHVNAMYRIGYAYIYGMGAEKDSDKGLVWMRLAADRGHDEAQFRLGLWYDCFADDISLDHKEYDKNPDAFMHKFRLNSCKSAENKEKAVKWYRKAAGQGHIEATSNLEELLDYLKKHR